MKSSTTEHLFYYVVLLNETRIVITLLAFPQGLLENYAPQLLSGLKLQTSQPLFINFGFLSDRQRSL